MLLLAAALTIFIGLAHSYLGEKWLIGPIIAQERLPVPKRSQTFAKQTLRFAWHITSLAWWAIAGLMIYIHFVPGGALTGFLWMCAILFGITGLIPIIVGKGRHKSWIVFLSIAAITGYLAASA